MNSVSTHQMTYCCCEGVKQEVIAGPAVWAKMFHLCGGHSQSPVKLDTTITVTYHHPRIMWWNYSLKPQVMTISNNGHTGERLPLNFLHRRHE